MSRVIFALAALTVAALVQPGPAASAGLSYSTFIGGLDEDRAEALALDRGGNAYVTGKTYSGDYPATPGAFDPVIDDAPDAFVTKLNASGSALVYSTFLGGDGYDWAFDLALDRAGNAFVTGFTTSVDFPTTPGAFDREYDSAFDVFVTKLNPAGRALVYSTFLGGGAIDYGHGIAVDRDANAYVTERAESADFPTTPGAFDTTHNSEFLDDAFVTKLNASGSALEYSTFLGGEGGDQTYDIALDGARNAYVTGEAKSPDFPTTQGAFDRTFNGNSDIFVTKLNEAGSALEYSTFVGGADWDVGSALALDANGNGHVTGLTYSPDFPTTSGALDTSFGGYLMDAYVTKLNAAGGALVYSTFLGGTKDDWGNTITLDPNGKAHVAGGTWSANFPTSLDAWDRRLDGTVDAFMSRLGKTGRTLPYSTFLGGTSFDDGAGLALGRKGDVYVGGITGSADFPTTRGAFDEAYNGDYPPGDVFVTKLRP